MRVKGQEKLGAHKGITAKSKVLLAHGGHDDALTDHCSRRKEEGVQLCVWLTAAVVKTWRI